MVNELELYDYAMAEFFKLTAADCGDPIPLVFAPPQRAFAALEDLYEKQGITWDATKNERIPLPATALHRGLPLSRPEGYRFTDRWVNSYRSPPDHKKVDVMGPPQTVTIDYSLELWSYTQVEMLNMVKQLTMKFRGELAYIVVNLQEYGIKRFSVQNNGITDSSVLEPQEEERALRGTMSVALNAVLFQPLETRRTILTVETQVRDLETDELLSTSEVSADD